MWQKLQEIADRYSLTLHTRRTPVPCRWKFWPIGHYVSIGYDYAGNDPSYTSSFPFGESVDLMATATVGGIPYVFSASNYERDDFRNHSLSI